MTWWLLPRGGGGEIGAGNGKKTTQLGGTCQAAEHTGDRQSEYAEGRSIVTVISPLTTTEVLDLDEPAPSADPTTVSRAQQIITAALLLGPVIGVLFAIISLFGRGVSVLDLVLAVIFYAIAGHGVTAGYHRMLTHRAFKARRSVKIALAIAGSLAFEGGVISWVANHRRHHAYTDRDGDPHSPYLSGTTTWGRVRGACHAHVGWLFKAQPTEEARWAPDLVSDRDLVVINNLFPLFCAVSLAMPALLGLAITGTIAGGVSAFVWAGLARVFVLQHATFAVNSACHLWGKRPYRTRTTDRATNFAPLALFSMGENWHNLHHSLPSLARHGVDKGQLDTTAMLISLLEKAGAVSEVRWPKEAELALRRLPKREGALGRG